jgi:hypothetical protein
VIKTQDSVRQIAAEQKLTKQALRELAGQMGELAGQMGELAAVQKRSEERFQRWLERGSNGGKGRR